MTDVDDDYIHPTSIVAERLKRDQCLAFHNAGHPGAVRLFCMREVGHDGAHLDYTGDWYDISAPTTSPDDSSSKVGDAKWRVGRKVGRTLYRDHGEGPNEAGELIGVMDTREMAAQVVEARAICTRLVELAATYGHQLGCSSIGDDDSGCDCALTLVERAREAIK